MNWSKILQQLPMVGQLGLSLVTPVLLCLALCWWLCDRFGLGGWIYIPGFIFGIGASFMTAYKLYLKSVRDAKKNETDEIRISKHM